jgi:uncharacterized membrane protein YfcA
MSPVEPRTADSPARLLGAAFAGAIVGAVGGLIGLGGAEYRLPLLLSVFGFPPLQAVILNKALSLVVVATALPARGVGVPWSFVRDHWTTAANVLAGSIGGAWFGAGWATRLRSESLARVIAALFVLIAAALFLGQQTNASGMPPGVARVVVGVALGFGIGIVAALLGVAGGELLIPTFVLLFGLDIKLAGSLSLVVSLPTMLTGFSRYSRDRSFVVLRDRAAFLTAMAVGSIAGSAIGGLLVGVVPTGVLLPALALILLISAFGLWRHGTKP